MTALLARAVAAVVESRWGREFAQAVRTERMHLEHARTVAWRASMNDPAVNHAARLRQIMRDAAQLRMARHRWPNSELDEHTAARWEKLAMEYVSHDHCSVEQARRILDVPNDIVFGPWAKGDG